jgi:hypothetical protein
VLQIAGCTSLGKDVVLTIVALLPQYSPPRRLTGDAV